MRASRRALLVGALLVSVGQAAAPQGRDIRIRDFAALITVNSNGTFDVLEQLTVRFDGQWNGIVRDLSLRHNTAQGRSARLDLDVLTVTDGKSEPLRVEQEDKDGGWTRALRIWVPGAVDADRTVVIRYRVRNGIRFFSESSNAGALDELYWNVTGNGWTMVIDSVHGRVVLPSGVNATRIAVYTGASRSTAKDATIRTDGNEVAFASTRALLPRQGLTIGVGWPPGHISSRPSAAQQRLADLLRWWPLALPFLVFTLAYNWWDKRGRDPHELAIVVQYEPPDKLSPAEMGTLTDNKADMKDITSTLVDLAVRGFIHIQEITEKRLLGLASSTDYVFRLLKPPGEWTALAPHEHAYLAALRMYADDDDSTVKMSELRDKFYHRLPGIRDAVYDKLVDRGYYLRRPDKAKAGMVSLGVFVLFSSQFLMIFRGRLFGGASIGAITVAVAATGIILIVFGMLMPARTDAGARTREASLGFKEFLSRVETDRYRRMITSPEMFERFLPYAMAFGVEDRWAKAFENIYREPPQWYSGGSGHFSATSFSHSINTMSTAAASTMSSSPSSSGSGGGGSSGGGSGGGGGSGF